MSRLERTLYLAILLLLNTQEEGMASGFRLEVKGYAKYLSEADHVRDPDTLLTGQLIHQRTQLRADFNDHWYAKLELRTRAFLGPIYEGQPGLVQTLKHPYSYFRPEVALVDDRHVTVFTEADRAYAGYRTDRWDVRLGKQRINWGTNLIWNPNDVFNSYNILDFDYEERPGTDALRIQYDLLEQRAVDIAYAPSKDGRTVAAGMYRTHLSSFDLQFSGGLYRGQTVIGIGWAGNIGKAGFKGEFNHYLKNTKESGQTCAAVTIDYTLKGNWYVFAAGLWQHQSAVHFQASNFFSGESAITPKFLMPFHYCGYLGAMKELTPQWSVQLATIYGETNESMILFPGATWKVTDNFELLLTGQGYWTRRENTWGNRADALYLRFKYNF